MNDKQCKEQNKLQMSWNANSLIPAVPSPHALAGGGHLSRFEGAIGAADVDVVATRGQEELEESKGFTGPGRVSGKKDRPSLGTLGLK